ncbi:urocanase, putative [Phytophthora infestans T30-4]|uniref:Urocanase, putative n=1 Tax=Phytophthora infestans (strain T30-4) TaxID=403677 RepID=D0NM43_PHYIT|nr:urocanase, putative [Phytophthora infestans T30-4]EEY60764.1 urocanase, putative [Phytophthora infestans T30-4]|eukprot:XP_002899710.1 urocanase, putative [Phytophthora infestans T30-4]
MSSVDLSILRNGIPAELPAHPGNHPDPTLPKAPHRNIDGLSKDDLVLAVQNALRYFPERFHATLAPEFAQELKDEGHIYMHRFRPVQYEMKAYPIDQYPAKCKQAASIMLMIMNNLDRRVAQFPNHLVTYGGNGSVFQNWAQYLVAMRYLSELTEQQTLVMYSGHPMGLFPSRPAAPRMVVTNGLMIPNYSTRAQYDKAYAMGNTQYGQMTAGSYCYIGPQGIVHGTTITIDESAVKKRHEQGWVDEVVSDLDACVVRIREAKAKGEVVSLAYHGNVVTLWERLADEAEATGELLVELGSDQTSLHNPFNGGYYPVQLSFEESQRVMAEDPERFQELVQESLRRHAVAINRLTAKGMRFWDYGNSFLLEAQRAGADVLRPGVKPEEAAVSTTAFKYPSYVQDIMGDIFSLGFGPFRWVCTSGDHADLQKTDAIAARVMRELLAEPEVPDRVAAQLRDNLRWIEAAEENKLVVGSEARILYADRVGRGTIAMAFNAAVASGELSAPVVLSRDHHDVSGTDSPFRETSNVTDGSAFCADMAVQNALGDAARGATWIALHNGGGVGWGEVMNGGFGMVLDGSDDAREKAACMLGWDVNNGVARRAWARNANARFAIEREMKADPLLTVTLANEADDASVRDAVSKLF